MKAVDTNVLIRFFIADDAAQFAAARSLVSSGAIWVAKTVVLETIWVLRSVYLYGEQEIHGAITALLHTENILVEDSESLLTALSLADSGMSLTDAIHVAGTPSGVKFVSFDRKLVNRAIRAGLNVASVH